jgi:hypothetical protein
MNLSSVWEEYYFDAAHALGKKNYSSPVPVISIVFFIAKLKIIIIYLQNPAPAFPRTRNIMRIL